MSEVLTNDEKIFLPMLAEEGKVGDSILHVVRAAVNVPSCVVKLSRVMAKAHKSLFV
jgi:hypothetical protein